jgi:hypothetical protein
MTHPFIAIVRCYFGISSSVRLLLPPLKIQSYKAVKSAFIFSTIILPAPMTDHLQQRKRLQSVSLDGLVVDPGPPPGSTTDDPRSSMETFTFEDLKYLDFEQSSILKHLAQDLRRSSTEQLSRQPAMLNGFKPRGPAQPPMNGPINGSRVQPDLTRSLTPSPKQLSEFNVSYDALRDENVLLRQEVDALVKKVARMLKVSDGSWLVVRRFVCVKQMNSSFVGHLLRG